MLTSSFLFWHKSYTDFTLNPPSALDAYYPYKMPCCSHFYTSTLPCILYYYHDMTLNVAAAKIPLSLLVLLLPCYSSIQVSIAVSFPSPDKLISLSPVSPLIRKKGEVFHSPPFMLIWPHSIELLQIDTPDTCILMKTINLLTGIMFEFHSLAHQKPGSVYSS